MKKGNPAPLSATEKAALEALAAMPDSGIDTSDIPSQTNWTGAMRGAFYRPIKKPVSLRLDADIVDWFQQQGAGYQTRINDVLRDYVERRQKGHG
jgi:uncharacterized protein (DUF4415 family)